MTVSWYIGRTDGRYSNGRRVWLFVKAGVRRRRFIHVEVGSRSAGIWA